MLDLLQENARNLQAENDTLRERVKQLNSKLEQLAVSTPRSPTADDASRSEVTAHKRLQRELRDASLEKVGKIQLFLNRPGLTC